MPIIGDPFIANVNKMMSTDELIQALRVDIADEMEAIISYEVHIQSTDDGRVKKVLRQIADEERQHVGELQQLISLLFPGEDQKIDKGKQMVVQQQQQNFQGEIQ